MAGEPSFFDVTNLEVLQPAAASGSPKNNAVELGIGGDPFDVLVTFEITPTTNWWGLAEVLSDLNPGMVPQAQTKVFFESIGPGPEPVIAGPPVTLTVGGTHNVAAGTSTYQVRVPIANADTLFVDGAGALAPGSYRVQCRVDWDIPGTPSWFATATYDGDVIIRVAVNL